MNIENIKKTFRQSLVDNRFLRAANLIMAVAMLILAVAAFNKKTTVIIQPPPLSNQASIGPSDASPEMYKTWGLHIAGILGNVNPDTASFVVNAISPLLTARMYDPVRSAVETQAKKLAMDHITISFSPSGIEYEPNDHIVTVFGELTTRGVRNAIQREERTYRMRLVVVNYRVLLDDLTVFPGRQAPKTDN